MRKVLLSIIFAVVSSAAVTKSLEVVDHVSTYHEIENFPPRPSMNARRVLRGSLGSATTEITLKALGQELALELVLDDEILHPELTIYRIQAGQEEEQGNHHRVLVQTEDVDRDCVFRGKVKNEPNSRVTLNYCDGMVFGSIESSERGLDLVITTTYNTNQRRTLVYKRADVNVEESGECGNDHSKEEKHRHLEEQHQEEEQELEDEYVTLTSTEDDDDDDVVEPDTSATAAPTSEKEHDVIVVPKSLVIQEDSDTKLFDPSTMKWEARTFQSDAKYVKIILVCDAARHRLLGSNFATTVAATKAIATRIKTIYDNFPVDESGFEVKIQVVGIVVIETESDPWGNSFLSSTTQANAGFLQTAFNSWRTTALSQKKLVPHTAAHLLSGYDFEGVTVGISALSAACDFDTATGVNQATSSNNEFIAKIVAHELGHSIGLRHTNVYIPGSAVSSSDDVNACLSNGAYHVMAAGLVGGASYFTWESCSAKWWRSFLIGFPDDCTGGSCTYSRSYGSSWNPSLCMETPGLDVVSGSQCGDGILDEGEECDCGTEASCASKDPCCDARTCKFRSGATCSATQACCDADTCNPVSATSKKVCRSSQGSCDKAETCNGRSASCPTDTYAAWGTSCTIPGISAPNAICYQGKCLSHVAMCNAVRDKYQVSSDIGGECTRAGDDDGDFSCGKLYCKRLADDFCGTNYYGPNLLVVPDGAPCGEGQGCLAGKCISISGSGVSPTSPPTAPTSPPSRIPPPPPPDTAAPTPSKKKNKRGKKRGSRG